MFPIIINPIPLILTISTTFGVLVHDAHLSQLAGIASIPVVAAAYVATADFVQKSDPHTHIERASLRRTTLGEPSIQPRIGNDKKYISLKKYSSNSFGSDYCWPSA